MTSFEKSAVQLDALGLSDAIRRRLVDFSADDRFARDKTLDRICRGIWQGPAAEGGLLSDLWVEGAFPAKLSSDSLASLVTVGKFDADLAQVLDASGAIPAERLLYEHQKDALLQCQMDFPDSARPALVVTAGTGAGKTECFLLPILNDLFRSPRSGQGVKCLILYPMNALVNDQVDRLYGWLRGQSAVRLFHFTSETPEDKRAADYDRVPHWDECRLRTRQEARGLESRTGVKLEGGPLPDILITNYSMLEYMLCRPQDGVFFGDALRAVVLDEAHLYTGTLAAEITLLLRRLYARCGVEANDVLQIATSATLGGGSTEDLQRFASTIFSKEVDKVRVIVGESQKASFPEPIAPDSALSVEKMNSVTWVERPFVVANRSGDVVLAESAELCRDLGKKLAMLTRHGGSDSESVPARLLFNALRYAPIVHQLEEVIWNEKRLPLPTLAKKIWNDEGAECLRATFSLLQLTASARSEVGSYPLIPHRIHLLARASDGFSICLNGECEGPERLRLSPLGTVTGGQSERCPHCEASMLMLYRCGNCGEWVLAGFLDGNRLRALPMEINRLTFLTTRRTSDGDAVAMTLSVANGERAGSGAGGVEVRAISSCPSCGEESTDFQPISSGPALTLAILAETLLAEAPAFPAAHNTFLPARGRRLLAFSDSRQEAARLGPRLTRQHEIQLVRAAIAQSLTQRLAADPETLAFLKSEIHRLEQMWSQAATPALQQKIERDIRDQRRELASHEAGGSMADWAEAMGTIRLLSEVLDVNNGMTHQAMYEQSDGSVTAWSQKEWDRNAGRVKANAMIQLAREFAAPNWRAISLATLGLAEITYSGLNDVRLPEPLAGSLSNDAVRSDLSAVWGEFLASLCDTLRMDGAVTLGSNDEDWGFQTGGVPIGRWSAKHEIGVQLVRFVGQTTRQARRRFAAEVLAACGSRTNSEELAREVLEAAYDQLLGMAKTTGQGPEEGQLSWLERDQRQSATGMTVDGIRVDFTELGLRRPLKIFRCDKTGHVWPRSVAGCAPETGCDGTLRLATDEELNADPRLGRLRQEYFESPVFKIGLWAEEHSAQLSPQQNRRLQDLFKAGIRNILSATTTLELGIDIGGLSLALLGNVPPSKANYLQRAGRAGRRADGSSAVVTFARARPFDREVFRRFGDFLDQPLRKPLVLLDRERVVRRHFHAYLLGEFFRSLYGPSERKGAMDAFGNMSRFCGKPLVPYWKEQSHVPSLPVPPPSLESAFRQRLFELRDYGNDVIQGVASSLFANSGLADAVSDWPDLMQAAIDKFTQSINDWNDDYEMLLAAWIAAVGESRKAQANAVRYQLKTLAEMTVIEALADRQFLPRYGFPIGLQKLRIIAPDGNNPTRVREEDQFRLERSGIMAVAEYVPGSQLLAGGKLITSHGLLKHWTGASLDASPGLRGQFCQCVNDHLYYWIAGEADQCPICQGAPKRSPQSLLFVKHGFTSAAWDPPKWSTDVERVGRAETVCISFRPHSRPANDLTDEDFAGIRGLRVEYRESGELLVINRGDNLAGFAVCLRCGYADSEPMTRGSGQMNLPTSFVRHAPITATRPWDVCWREGDRTAVLRNQILAARETTDVLLIDLSGCLGALATDDALVTTLAYAFRNAAARLLELDSRELGVIVVPTGQGGGSRGAVLYDNAPGGAGHVRELLAQGPAWIHEARRVLYVSDGHHERCEGGCLDCLLSYDAQIAMARRPFVRREACHALSALLT